MNPYKVEHTVHKRYDYLFVPEIKYIAGSNSDFMYFFGDSPSGECSGSNDTFLIRYNSILNDPVFNQVTIFQGKVLYPEEYLQCSLN